VIHIHFHDKEFVEAEHPRNHGKFAAKGGAQGFVSPNEGMLDFPTAVKALGGKQQKLFREMSPEIDRLAGIDDSTTESALGAWKTGAEHSTITHMHNVTPERAELALALKGLMTNQLQVLRFVPTKGGGDYMASFEAKGTPGEIHQALLDHGVEFHTLQPKEGGATVHVYGSDQETLDNVAKAAKGAKVSLLHGKGTFIGTHKEDGTDAEQRADARRVYQEIIDRAVTAGKLRGNFSSRWDSLRDRWRREAQTGDRRRAIRIGDRLWLHPVTYRGVTSPSVPAAPRYSRGHG